MITEETGGFLASELEMIFARIRVIGVEMVMVLYSDSINRKDFPRN